MKKTGFPYDLLKLTDDKLIEQCIGDSFHGPRLRDAYGDGKRLAQAVLILRGELECRARELEIKRRTLQSIRDARKQVKQEARATKTFLGDRTFFAAWTPEGLERMAENLADAGGCYHHEEKAVERAILISPLDDYAARAALLRFDIEAAKKRTCQKYHCELCREPDAVGANILRRAEREMGIEPEPRFWTVVFWNEKPLHGAKKQEAKLLYAGVKGIDRRTAEKRVEEAFEGAHIINVVAGSDFDPEDAEYVDLRTLRWSRELNERNLRRAFGEEEPARRSEVA